MNARQLFMAAGIVWGPLLALAPLGCSKGGSTASSGIDVKGEGAHIAIAGSHVGKYMADNKGQAPKNTGEMKDWAAKNNIAEDEFLSTRDHEPYEVHVVTQGPMKNIVVTETTGVNGKKFMWQATSRAPSGSEATQEQIDSTLKASGTGRRGRP
ncbi:MAG TPA: hypothetical protein VGX70_21355 [Gemmataceae bacterium]|jgi:hypothetical protein|nr:hypothetical protein [Gemmataceae bacterium]